MRSASTSDVDSDTGSVCSDVSTISDLSSDLTVDLAPTAEMEEGEIEDEESPEWEIEAVEIESKRPERKRPLTFTINDDDEDANSDGFGLADADLFERPPLMSKQANKQSKQHSIKTITNTFKF